MKESTVGFKVLTIMCNELICPSGHPLRIVYNYGIGMRGMRGIQGTLIDVKQQHKKTQCQYCLEFLRVGKEYEKHIAMCLFTPVSCDLCQKEISERQFLFQHKIYNCPFVKECKECLSYYSCDNHVCKNEDNFLLDLYDGDAGKNIMPLITLDSEEFIILQVGKAKIRWVNLFQAFHMDLNS